MYVILYLVHIEDPNAHPASKVRTFIGSDDILKNSLSNKTVLSLGLGLDLA